ncbi:MAG: hypothetical protein EZS28_012830 [Streblomastix strix]|uniref:Inositol polyphosphate-related phosphatase domain-containing protein n=1 Tax=Streblomastix strix TaxID=222440 RepID=A0A5J4WAU1_9EUKA|nr:MAG: hypothetical protein EZS28_012830 [Streblomastix strix]
MQNSFHCGIEVNVEQLLLFCGTFNVGAKAPPLDSLRPWLFLDHQLCHIYVITLQEIVELNAKHFILTDDTNQKLWNQKILDELGNNFDMV